MTQSSKTSVYRWGQGKIIPLNSLHRKQTPDKGVTVDLSYFHWLESNTPPFQSDCALPSSSSGRSGQSEAFGGCDCVFQWKKSVYKAVERHTSPSWYWAWVCDANVLSWPLKLSLWNSLVMADRDLPWVSGRNIPTYSADNRQTAPKGTKQYSLNSLCKRKAMESCQTDVRQDINNI